jgi:hypothetical protein
MFMPRYEESQKHSDISYLPQRRTKLYGADGFARGILQSRFWDAVSYITAATEGAPPLRSDRSDY